MRRRESRSGKDDPLFSPCASRIADSEIQQPCTNCVAFSIECKIPTPKRKKTQSGKQKDSDRYGSRGPRKPLLEATLLTRTVTEAMQSKDNPLEMTPQAELEARAHSIPPMAHLLPRSLKHSIDREKATRGHMLNS